MKTRVEIGRAIYEKIERSLEKQALLNIRSTGIYHVSQMDYDYLEAYAVNLCIVPTEWDGTKSLTFRYSAGEVKFSVMVGMESWATQLFPELQQMTLHAALQKLAMNRNNGKIRHATDLGDGWFNPNECSDLGSYSIEALSSSGWQYKADVKKQTKVKMYKWLIHKGGNHYTETDNYYPIERAPKTDIRAQEVLHPLMHTEIEVTVEEDES